MWMWFYSSSSQAEKPAPKSPKRSARRGAVRALWLAALMGVSTLPSVQSLAIYGRLPISRLGVLAVVKGAQREGAAGRQLRRIRLAEEFFENPADAVRARGFAQRIAAARRFMAEMRPMWLRSEYADIVAAGTVAQEVTLTDAFQNFLSAYNAALANLNHGETSANQLADLLVSHPDHPVSKMVMDTIHYGFRGLDDFRMRMSMDGYRPRRDGRLNREERELIHILTARRMNFGDHLDEVAEALAALQVERSNDGLALTWTEPSIEKAYFRRNRPSRQRGLIEREFAALNSRGVPAALDRDVTDAIEILNRGERSGRPGFLRRMKLKAAERYRDAINCSRSQRRPSGVSMHTYGALQLSNIFSTTVGHTINDPPEDWDEALRLVTSMATFETVPVQWATDVLVGALATHASLKYKMVPWISNGRLSFRAGLDPSQRFMTNVITNYMFSAQVRVTTDMALFYYRPFDRIANPHDPFDPDNLSQADQEQLGRETRARASHRLTGWGMPVTFIDPGILYLMEGGDCLTHRYGGRGMQFLMVAGVSGVFSPFIRTPLFLRTRDWWVQTFSGSSASDLEEVPNNGDSFSPHSVSPWLAQNTRYRERRSQRGER
jgi:hypothetical protein